MNARRDEGFTVMELIVSVAIVGLLSGILLMLAGGITGAADSASCAADRRALESASEAYFAQQSTDTIPASGDAESYELTLVANGFLQRTSVHFDLDAHGRLVPVAGSTCTD
jgi:prepilin-type N-terminal cleavage/methylation domain-containing protein